ncbi:MAG: hypothetical protein H0X64_13430, partial [Gemmatimonadaceae bacterium]|nr:hypothetical protein [Gemmatimonadaceae bacterium]
GYTPRPGTAIYVGYGDQWHDEADLPGPHDRHRFERVRRTMFDKVSKGWRR